MALYINHVYTTTARVNYYRNNKLLDINDTVCSTMDGIAEHMCEVLNRNHCESADAFDVNTGEVIIKIERT